MTPKSFDIPDVPDIPGLDDDDDSGRRGGGGGGRGRRPRRWLWLVVGIVLGVLGTIFLPGLTRPYLPAALRGHANRVEGLVVRKGHENGRLLLTVDTRQGAMLATFDKKVPEIDLLVSQGDSVTLGVQAYRPFIEQPDLLGVRKFPSGTGARGPASGAVPGSAAAGPTSPPAGSTARGADTIALPDTGSGSPMDTTAPGRR